MDFVADSLVAAMGGLDPLLKEYQMLGEKLNAIDIDARLLKMDSLLVDTQTFLSRLNSDEGTLGQLITNDSLYNNLNLMMSDLDSLLINFRYNPKRYVHSLFSVEIIKLHRMADLQPRKEEEKELIKNSSFEFLVLASNFGLKQTYGYGHHARFYYLWNIDFNKNDDQMRQLVFQLNERLKQVKLGGGLKKIESQHKSGKTYCKERIDYLIDEESNFWRLVHLPEMACTKMLAVVPLVEW